MKAIVRENPVLPGLAGDVVACFGFVSKHAKGDWMWIESAKSGVWTLPAKYLNYIDPKNAAEAIEINTLYVGKYPANSEGRIYGPVSGDTRTLLEKGNWRWYTDSTETKEEQK